MLDDKWLHTVTLMMQQNGVDPTGISKGTLKDLASQVSRGAARLMFDATEYQRLVRVVTVVEVCIKASATEDGVLCDPLVLVELPSAPQSASTFSTEGNLPVAVREPHEQIKETAVRLLRDQLGLPDGAVHIGADSPAYTEEEVTSAIEVLPSIQCKYTVDCEVATRDTKVLRKIGFPGGRPWSCKGKRLAWVDALLLDGAMGPTVSADGVISRLVPAPFGPTLSELKKFMQRKGVDISPATHKSLEDLFAETRKGDASLVLDPKGDITHVIDIVLLQVVDPKTNMVLIETERTVAGGGQEKAIRLPSSKRRPDENHFFTVWRLLGEQLTLDSDMVAVDATDIRFFEEEKDSAQFPGLKTVYRTRLMKASLQDSARKTEAATEAKTANRAKTDVPPGDLERAPRKSTFARSGTAGLK